MDNEQLQGMNKIIHRFLGYELIPRSHYKEMNPALDYFGKMDKYGTVNELICEVDLKYHSDWNWVMRSVEKIELLQGEDGRGKVNYIVSIETGYCVISLGGEQIIAEAQTGDSELTKIELVHRAVYDFITWYNDGGDK